MHPTPHNDITPHMVVVGNNPARLFIWAHGWGHSHETFKAMAEGLQASGTHYLIDFPGFGATPRPEGTWTTADYADHMARWLDTLPHTAPRIWVGHSFGCRVGLRLAARHPGAVDGMFLIAAAGLPKKRPLHVRAYMYGRVKTYKALKKLLLPLGFKQERLARYFGSADYRNAGAIRDIFMATIRENLLEVARHVACPVQFCYGADDTDTPPDIGKRFTDVMPHATLTVVPGYNHHTILTAGRHQVLAALKPFAQNITTTPKGAAPHAD